MPPAPPAKSCRLAGMILTPGWHFYLSYSLHSLSVLPQVTRVAGSFLWLPPRPVRRLRSGTGTAREILAVRSMRGGSPRAYLCDSPDMLDDPRPLRIAIQALGGPSAASRRLGCSDSLGSKYRLKRRGGCATL